MAILSKTCSDPGTPPPKGRATLTFAITTGPEGRTVQITGSLEHHMGDTVFGLVERLLAQDGHDPA
jgi:hypothetical protein